MGSVDPLSGDECIEQMYTKRFHPLSIIIDVIKKIYPELLLLLLKMWLQPSIDETNELFWRLKPDSFENSGQEQCEDSIDIFMCMSDG